MTGVDIGLGRPDRPSTVCMGGIIPPPRVSWSTFVTSRTDGRNTATARPRRDTVLFQGNSTARTDRPADTVARATLRRDFARSLDCLGRPRELRARDSGAGRVCPVDRPLVVDRRVRRWHDPHLAMGGNESRRGPSERERSLLFNPLSLALHRRRSRGSLLGSLGAVLDHLRGTPRSWQPAW